MMGKAKHPVRKLLKSLHEEKGHSVDTTRNSPSQESSLAHQGSQAYFQTCLERTMTLQAEGMGASTVIGGFEQLQVNSEGASLI